MLKAVRENLDRVDDLTVGPFYREADKLGGFLGRESDSQPGWINICRGWEELNTLVRAAKIASQSKTGFQKCGQRQGVNARSNIACGE